MFHNNIPDLISPPYNILNHGNLGRQNHVLQTTMGTQNQRISPSLTKVVSYHDPPCRFSLHYGRKTLWKRQNQRFCLQSQLLDFPLWTCPSWRQSHDEGKPFLRFGRWFDACSVRNQQSGRGKKFKSTSYRSALFLTSTLTLGFERLSFIENRVKQSCVEEKEPNSLNWGSIKPYEFGPGQQIHFNLWRYWSGLEVDLRFLPLRFGKINMEKDWTGRGIHLRKSGRHFN